MHVMFFLHRLAFSHPCGQRPEQSPDRRKEKRRTTRKTYV